MEVFGIIIWRAFLQVIGLDWVHHRPISAVAHYHLLAVVYRGALMESFVGLVQILLFRALPECFLEVSAGIFEVSFYFQRWIIIDKESQLPHEDIIKSRLYIPPSDAYARGRPFVLLWDETRRIGIKIQQKISENSR